MMIIQSLVSDDIPNDIPHVRLALYQGRGTAGDMVAVEANLAVLEATAAKAKAYWVHLLSFPELFLTGYDVTDAETARGLAEKILCENILGEVAEAAKRNDLAIICPYPEAATVAGERRY
jgi:predicted amidohydrolase